MERKNEVCQIKATFSCIVDRDPKFIRQALVWASSLLAYARQDPDTILVHTIGSLDSKYSQILHSWGIQTYPVQPFDLRHAKSNKLSQLGSEALYSADYAVLCDCDIAFCGSISPWIEGDCIRARSAFREGLRPQQWEQLFRTAGLKLPAWTGALVTGGKTLPSYCNGGLYIIPRMILHDLRKTWCKWDRWLLDNFDGVRPVAAYIDQISFALSCEELGLRINYLPIELNFPAVGDIRFQSYGWGGNAIHPLVLHYHRTDDQGLLLPSRIASVNREIERINFLIKQDWTDPQCPRPDAPMFFS